VSRPKPAAPPPGLTADLLEIDGRTVLVISYPVADTAEPAPPPIDLPGLSAAERQVVELLLQGHERAAIARLRGTALGTVHKQIERIYRKLGVRSRRELTARVLGKGAGSS
jgi:DNA-binding CsgD family transcriptional regulator